MSGKWDYLRRRAEANDMPLLVNAGELLALITQAERAERLEQAMRQLIDQPHSSPHELLRAAMKGETP